MVVLLLLSVQCGIPKAEDRVLRSLSRIISLSSIDFHAIEWMSYLPPLNALTNLRTIIIDQLPQVVDLDQPLSPSVEYLALRSLPRIRNLPQFLSSMTNLRHLEVTGCLEIYRFVEIPQGPELPNGPGMSLQESTEQLQMRALHQLTSLLVMNTSLASIPVSISCLSRIQTLGFTNCAISTIPSSISKMTSLTGLNFPGCRSLSSIPDGISCLTRLICLRLNSCPKLQSLPAWISRLTGLTELALTFSGFTSLPSGITELSKVETFLFGNYENNPFPRLRSLPDISALGAFQQLELQLALEMAIQHAPP